MNNWKYTVSATKEANDLRSWVCGPKFSPRQEKGIILNFALGKNKPKGVEVFIPLESLCACF